MASPKAAWGIEIGAHAIKAVRLERTGDQVQVSDFAYIPHKKVLTTPDLDQDEMVRLSLGQFISQKELEGEHLVMSVPGHAAFARFAKLPPVEPKKVPDIVKFEAVQQIPFPIDQVEWDYQTFSTEDSPEIEVGIFAITRERVQERLGLYGELGIGPESLTLSPVALFNAMSYDYQLSNHRDPVVFLDIGTQATDVVIAQEGRCWIRTFPLGGTHFTEAIANSFKLSYSKAEKLKCEATTSKYAKQIMQAMRPVFSDLLQDLQRSIGYYQSVQRDHELSTMIGIGSTFKIPGLRKFIGQQLQINVQRLDEFKRIPVTGRDAATFAEHTVNLATAYGLALQGVGLAPIDANLVPAKALREQMWQSKTKWFGAAAAVIVAGTATMLYHPMTQRSSIGPSEAPPEVKRVLDLGGTYKSQYQQLQQNSDVGFTATNMMRLTDDREIWTHLVNDVTASLASSEPQPTLLGSDPEAILEIEPESRRLLELTNLSGEYFLGGEQGNSRRMRVRLLVRTSHQNPGSFINGTAMEWLRTHTEPEGDRADVPYRILLETVDLDQPGRTEHRVTSSGVETKEGSSSGGTRGGSGGGGLKPPTGTGGSSGSGSGGSGFGFGGGPGAGSGGGASPPGRRQPPAGGSGGRGAPGGGGGFGAGAGGGGASPPGRRGSGGGFGAPGGGFGGTGSGSGNTGGSGLPGSTKDFSKLDEIAPMPSKPQLFPVGSTYYEFPIEFEIEILDANAKAKPVQSASTEGAKDGDQA